MKPSFMTEEEYLELIADDKEEQQEEKKELTREDYISFAINVLGDMYEDWESEADKNGYDKDRVLDVKFHIQNGTWDQI